MRVRTPVSHFGLSVSAFLILIVALLVIAAPTSPVAYSAAASNTNHTITWRVQTPTYTLKADGITVVGYSTYDEPGAPALPVIRKVIELPVTGDWSLDYDSATPQTLITSDGFKVTSVPAPAKDRDDYTDWMNSTPEVFVPVTDKPSAAIYGADVLYPARLAVAGEEVWQRGKRMLTVTVFPFQYNPVSGAVEYHPDINVRVNVTGIDPAIGSVRGHNDAVPQPSNESAREMQGVSAVRINTPASGGLVRLTYTELQNAGVPVATVNPQSFGMTYLGSGIDIVVTGEGDGQFNPGDLVIFYADPYLGEYMTSNVYWLLYGGANGARMAQRAAPQNTGITPTTTFTETTRVEFNRLYIGTIAHGLNTDRWWDNALSPNNSAPPESATKSVVYTLPLDDPARTGTVRVRANVHGLTNQSYNPDHAISMSLNGQALGTYTWEGAVEYTATASTPGTTLSTTTNALTMTTALSMIPGCPPDCPFSYTVYPNWVEADYIATTEAEGDNILLDKVTTGAERIRVTGLSSGSGGNVRVLDLRNRNRPVILTTTSATNTGSGFSVDFWDSALPNPSYIVSTDAALLAPVSLRLDTPSSLGSASNTAQYIAIVPELLSAPTAGLLGVDDLLAFREAEGIDTVKVDVQDIYDEFSFGRVDPQAIRDFLTYAYFNWNTGGEPPEYVLLVGDGDFDFKNYSNTPLLKLIPPYLLPVDPFLGEVPTDNRFVSVDGFDDFVPDMAIGRLSAQIKLDPTQPPDPPTYLSPAKDLDSMIRKIIANETTTPAGDWQRRAVFAADNFADPAGNFHALSDSIIDDFLPPSYTDIPLYYNSASIPDNATMRTAIKTAVNNDALMLQWFGHGSAYRWGSVSMFNIFDIDGYAGSVPLAPNDQYPFTLSYACVNSYFVAVGDISNAHIYQSLGESWLSGMQRGSLADIGPTGNHVGSAMLKLNEGVIIAAMQDREERVGHVMLDAKAYYLANSSFFYDLLDSTVLLGDPATRLRLAPIPHGNSTFVADDTTPDAGQNVVFTLNVANDGTTALTDVLLTIDYDETALSIVSAPGYTNNGDTLTATLASLPVGGVSRPFTAQVLGSVTNGLHIDNKATVQIARENKNMDVTLIVTLPATATPTPTTGPSPTATNTPTPGPSPTATNTPTPGPSPTATGTNTPGPSPTATSTYTPGPSPTATSTYTPGPSPTATSTYTPGPSPTATGTNTPGPSPTATGTNTPGPSPTATSTHTPGPSPTATSTHTPGPSPTATNTPTEGPSPTATTTPQEGNWLYLPLIQAN